MPVILVTEERLQKIEQAMDNGYAYYSCIANEVKDLIAEIRELWVLRESWLKGTKGNERSTSSGDNGSRG